MEIVTITSDLGTQDAYLAKLKGRLLRAVHSVQIIDLSNQINPYDIVHASIVLRNTIGDFPSQTIHLALVDPFYNGCQTLVYLQKNGCHYLAPDNGLLSIVFDEETYTNAIEFGIYNDFTELIELSIKVIASIVNNVELLAFGKKLKAIHKRIALRPTLKENQINTSIAHIDRFGNVITNLSKKEFCNVRRERQFQIYYKRNDPLDQICQRYNEVAEGEVVAIFNAAGFLEIAMHKANASKLLNLNKDETIIIEFK